MKRFLLLVISLSLVLCSCAKEKNDYNFVKTTTDCETTQNNKEFNNEEIRGIWISCFELPNAQKGEEYFTSEINKMLDNIKSDGFNTVFVHVRAFADSIYPSKIFPWAKYSCNSQNPNFDPLKIIVNLAKEKDLSLHAWINPFRVSSSDDVKSLLRSSPAVKMINENSSDIIVLPNGIYFNPASPAVHALIYSGVKEILENYDVDGIHIDDYFYPSTDESIDKKEFQAYKKSNGNMSLSQWRKNSVSAFVSGLYEITKEYSKILSISPSGNINYNEEKMYADIELWMREKGYADIIIPQIYYGFEHGKFPFKETALNWADLKKNENVRLLCGIAQYKVNKTDTNAGKNGESEWIENKNIIEKQMNCIRKDKRFNGFVIFSYSYRY